MWHLLSLDAPTVAALWTVFVSRCAGVRLSLADPVAMFLAVWLLYAADRLLDARPLAALASPSHDTDLEERHRFHHRHRRRFLRGLVTVTLPLAWLLDRLDAPVLHLYVVLATLLAGWLLLVHALPAPPGGAARRLPKELAVGLFFPAAVVIPTVARAPALRPVLLPGAVLFGAVCALNCLFLYVWEHPVDRSRAHVTTRWASRHMVALALLVTALSASWAWLSSSYPNSARPLVHPAGVPLACAFSGACLLLLHALRRRLPPLRLRALADLALLTPLLWWWPLAATLLRRWR